MLRLSPVPQFTYQRCESSLICLASLVIDFLAVVFLSCTFPIRIPFTDHWKTLQSEKDDILSSVLDLLPSTCHMTRKLLSFAPPEDT